MKEYIVDKLDLDYVTYEDLMKMAEDIPVGACPTYHYQNLFTDNPESYIDQSTEIK